MKFKCNLGFLYGTGLIRDSVINNRLPEISMASNNDEKSVLIKLIVFQTGKADFNLNANAYSYL